MNAIVNIKDAKALKRMGAPLNTPVRTVQFSPAYEKRWLALNKAKYLFEVAIYKYLKDGKNTSMTLWRLVKRRLRGLLSAIKGCDAAIGKLKDENEQALLSWFLVNRAAPFFNFWDQAIATVESGAGLEIRIPNDVPKWLDDEI